MADLLQIFMDKASELRNSEDKEIDFVRGIIDDPNFLELSRTDEYSALQILEDGFETLETSKARWGCLMAFIQTDAANVMAENVRTDDYRALASVIGRITSKMDPQDKEDFHEFLPLTRAGEKMLAKNARAAVAASGYDKMAALRMISSIGRD